MHPKSQAYLTGWAIPETHEAAGNPEKKKKWLPKWTPHSGLRSKQLGLT
jgi:hypothetical protein